MGRSGELARVSWLALALVACNHGATAEAPGSAAAPLDNRAPGPEGGETAKSAVESPGLLIGELQLAPKAVVDGDTIRVEGIDKPIRLLSIDTEERIHGPRDRAAIAEDFELYLKRKRGDAKRPRRAGTPMGERATEFAQAFFAGAEAVRLERDHAKQIRGHYGRPLAYAFVQKNGRWTNYSVECVRAGMSPYFTKYGYSHRFHNQFSHAEAEAKRAERGIWDTEARGYGDYDERKRWWNARADFIRAFEHEANGRDDLILLSHSDALANLEAKLGEEVTVLSTIRRIRRFTSLVRVSLVMGPGLTFPIIFFDKNAFEETGIAAFAGEPVRVRGQVERYEKGSYRTLQIVVRDPAQVTLPSLPSPS